MKKQIIIITLLMMLSAFSNVVVVLANKELVVLTSYSPDAQAKIKEEFESWYLDSTGALIDLSFGSVDRNDILDRVISAGGYVNDVAWDVWLGGSFDDMETLESLDLLEPFYLPGDPQWYEIVNSVPEDYFGIPLSERTLESVDYTWWASASTGYGIVYNKDYLASNSLQIPYNWEYLADPSYFGHLVVVPPDSEDWAHVIVESILQKYGWDEGWEILSKIQANVGYSAKDQEGAQLVSAGEYGIALVPDSYGYTEIITHGDDSIGFSYLPREADNIDSRIDVETIAILRNGPHLDTAQFFMKFILGPSGQEMLFNESLAKLPIREDVSENPPPGFPNPFDPPLTPLNYNAELASTRSDVVNDLYDTQLIVEGSELRSLWSEFNDIRLEIDDAISDGYNLGLFHSILEEVAGDLGRMPVSGYWGTANGITYSTGSLWAALIRSEWDNFAVEKYNNVSEMLSLTQNMLDSYTWYEGEIESVRSELNSLSAQNLDLGNHIEDLNGQISSLEEDVAGKAQEIQQLENHIEALDIAISSLEGEADALSGEVDALSGEVDALSGQITSLDSELANKNQLLLVAVIAGLVVSAGIAVFFRRKPGNTTRIRNLARDNPGLKTDHVSVLLLIANEGGGVYEADIRDLLSLPKSTVWRIIKKLEEEKLVEIKQIRRQNFVSFASQNEIVVQVDAE